jgi:hypothetical protein
VFFSKIDSYKVHSYKKKKIPIYPVTPLLASFVIQRLPQNQPPWHHCLPLLAQACGSGFIVAWGYHLRMPLQSQNLALVFSPWKKSCHSHPFSAAMMMINLTLMTPPLN